MYLTTTILQTEKHHEADMGVLRALCYQSARLYNAALYNVRQHYFENNNYLSYNDNWKLLKDSVDYNLLISDSAQQIMRLVDRDMQSFFKLLYLKRQGKYSEKVNLPRYKEKEGCSTFTVCGRSARIQKDETVNIGVTREFREKYNYSQRYIKFTVPKNLLWVKQFKEVRIIPQYGAVQFKVEFIYEAPKSEQAQGDGWMSVDMGVDNLMACTVFSNGGTRQFLIDGRTLKHINRYYNKTMARLKGERPDNSGTSKRMIRLMNGRDARIRQYFDIAVKTVVDICLREGVGQVVVGYNVGHKNGNDIGNVNNQNFVCIPHGLLRRKLEGKCQLHGIRYISQEESYTSQASCLDNDDIPTYDPTKPMDYKFSGRRVHRGLYRSSEGLSINADINGSVNILRKYFYKSKLEWIYHDSVRALVNAPCSRIICLDSSPSFRWG